METIRFRPLRSDDFPKLLAWLQRPHVKEWWDAGDDTLEKVIAHYSKDPETTKRFITALDGEDLGYIQYYKLDPVEIGVDQFLAIGDRLSQGLGTCCLSAFIDMVLKSETPERFVTDPSPKNARAIRCYEKCGFAPVPARSTATVYFMARNC